MFIKFHFKFIQQHFCRALFVEIWDISRVDYHVISAFVNKPAAMSFYLPPALWFGIARIMS